MLMKISGSNRVHCPWWRHQMETFSALLAIWAGNSPGPVNSLHKGQWRGALMFSLICVWINGWVNNREAGDLRCHCAHYDIIVKFVLLLFWLVHSPHSNMDVFMSCCLCDAFAISKCGLFGRVKTISAEYDYTKYFWGNKNQFKRWKINRQSLAMLVV